MSEDDIIYWQDILDLYAAGRVDQMLCPFCKKGSIQVTQRGSTTRFECPRCGRFLEGHLQE